MKNLILILFLFTYGMLVAAPIDGIPMQASSPFTVIQQTSQYVDIEFQLPEYQLSAEKMNNQVFQRISCENAGHQLQPGMPDVPGFSAYFSIPNQGSVNYELLDVEKNKLEHINLYPQQDDNDKASEQFTMNRTYYDNGGIYPQQMIHVSDPEILRDLRIVTLAVNPFSYDTRDKSLTINKKVRIRLHFASVRGANELSTSAQIVPSFEPIYRAQIINYEQNRDVAAVYSPERIMMITPYTTDATFLARLYSFIDWKKQKGYQVTWRMLPSTPTPTNSSIKTIIQNAYDSLAVRPTFVILIGDTSGTFTIPTWMHSWSSYNGEGDYPYTLLSGNDLLGDVMIGRMSISSYTDFQTLTGKGYLYERDIDISTAAWLNKLLLVGDTSSSGISTIYTNKYIKEIAAVHNPSLTFTEVYASPFSSQMDAGINSGCGFFNYRGYIGMSSWSPTTNLVNGYKVPHAVIITCGTGTFTGTSTTETFVRLGTSDTPKGAVTAIGMATAGTHTMLNNCLNGGIFQGIYTYDMHTMGQALLNGKLYLHRIYYVPDPDLTEAFQHICNLIGDPTLEVFTGIPSTFSVRPPTSIAAGSNQIEVLVNDEIGNPVTNAMVTCYKRDAVHVVGLTNSEGKYVAIIPTTVTDAITVTVSKQNFKPSISTVTINAAGGLVYNSTTIDDDSVAPSSGNNNGTANAGETIELQVGVKNTSASQINSVNGTLSTTTSGVMIMTSTVSYGNIAAGATANGATKYLFSLSNSIADNTPLNFKVNLTDSGTGRYAISFQVIARNGDMDITNVNISDSGNGVLDPGETTNLILTIANNGQQLQNAMYATLSTPSSLITINDATAYFGNMSIGGTATCSGNPFNITGKNQLLPGMVIPMNVSFYNSNGYAETEAITLSIGVVDAGDPIGPDIYGHFIYDMGDTNYPSAPLYSWIEIATPAGGSGTQVSITDVGTTSDEGDQVGSTAITTVTLPFTFTLYGIDYTQASICSNGFIGLGASTDGEFRNYTLPGALGPNPIIAAFWDDLSLPTGSGVYQYYNSAQHYWVVEWYNAKNGYDQASEETFQAILYDPSYYPTSNGDGMIKLQYKVFNNIDVGSTGGYTPTHGCYATIGIKDHTGLDGLQYTYNNTYPNGAAVLGNQTALLITGAPESYASAYLTLSDKTFIDGNNGILEPNEDIQIGVSLTNLGLQTGHNVSATLSSADAYISFPNATASYADLNPDQTAWGLSFFQAHISSSCPNGYSIPVTMTVTCTEGSWQRFFNMNVVKPGLSFNGYFINDQNGNNNGVPNSNESILLVINAYNSGTVDIANVNMTLSTSTPNVTLLDTSLACGVAASGTKIQKAFRVNLGTISDGTLATFNLGITGTNITAVNQVITMSIGTVGVNTDFETNDGNFTANVPTVLPGWQYGVTTKITENTTHLWGTDLTTTYPNNASWDLFSPMITVGVGSTLSFWHYYLVEANYDGGVVYVSTDGGTNWTIISPTGGYPNSSSHLAISPAYSCSYPTPTTGISGTATFDLSAYAGQSVILKWHFFSDIGVVNKGWFIDNVVVSGALTKTGRITGTITLSPTSPNVTNTVVKAGTYMTHPASDGSYSLYLPDGTYTTTALLSHYTVPTNQSLTISDVNPTQTGNFTLEFLAAPPSLSCNPVTGSIPLTWTARNERTLHFVHYNVWRRINGDSFRKIAEVTSTNYTDTPSLNGTYSYYITTDYTEGESGASNTVSFAYPIVHTAPNPVTLGLPANGATGIANLPTMTWTPSDGRISTGGYAREGANPNDRDAATVYYVYCDTNPNPTTLVGSPTTTQYTLVSPLAYSTTYYWKVVAHNSYGNSTGNTIHSFTTMSDPTPLNPPEEISISASQDGVEIYWSAVNEATIYRIYAVTDLSSNDWGLPIATVAAPDHSWVDTSGIPYRFYKVTADNPRIITTSDSNVPFMKN